MKTSTPKEPSKQGSSTPKIPIEGTRWCLTIHGADPNGNCPILNLLKVQFSMNKYVLAAVAYETGQHGIHPHWQVYFETSKKCGMKKRLCDLLGSQIGFHIEVAQGTRNANLRYIYAVTKQHQLGWVHFVKNCEPPKDYRPWKTQNLLWLRDNMKPWQAWITAKVTKTADYRDILWIVDPKGNTGKTYLAKYLHYFHGAILTGGKSEDMKHAIARWKQITGHFPVTIIIDLARSDRISMSGYKSIEEIKNAIFFSGKYQSGMVASCNPPNVVVFANVPPKLNAMSADRWVIRTICPKTLELVPWTQ